MMENLLNKLGLNQPSINDIQKLTLFLNDAQNAVRLYINAPIIPDELINLYENRIINIHPSLIPSFCGPGFYGLHVHEAAFKRGVKVAGATVHFVSSVVDGGPIILQEAMDVSNAKSASEMQEMILLNIEHKLLPMAVRLFCDGKLKVENERVIIL